MKLKTQVLFIYDPNYPHDQSRVQIKKAVNFGTVDRKYTSVYQYNWLNDRDSTSYESATGQNNTAYKL